MVKQKVVILRSTKHHTIHPMGKEKPQFSIRLLVCVQYPATRTGEKIRRVGFFGAFLKPSVCHYDTKELPKADDGSVFFLCGGAFASISVFRNITHTVEHRASGPALESCWKKESFHCTNGARSCGVSRPVDVRLGTINNRPGRNRPEGIEKSCFYHRTPHHTTALWSFQPATFNRTGFFCRKSIPSPSVARCVVVNSFSKGEEESPAPQVSHACCSSSHCWHRFCC